MRSICRVLFLALLLLAEDRVQQVGVEGQGLRLQLRLSFRGREREQDTPVIFQCLYQLVREDGGDQRERWRPLRPFQSGHRVESR